MKRITFRWAATLPWWLLVVALTGCSEKLKLGGLPNQLPEVTITEAPRDTNVVCDPTRSESCYAITLSWIGFDPDGSVDHYRYAVDPPSTSSADTAWQSTPITTLRLVLPASREVPRSANDLPKARDFHVFVVQAVDNRGAPGPSDSKAFFAYTQAPDVVIIDPLPSSVSIPILTPSVRIHWQGSDDDGTFHDHPVKYKYTLLTYSTEFSVPRALASPDSLRIYYAPSFATWDSVGGDTTSVQINNLSPDQEYVFVVVGFDEAGAYSPIFNLNTNMLRFRVGYAGQLGPKITAFSEFFQYTWRSSYCACTFSEYQLEMPAGKKLPISWTGEPANNGGDMRSYRWAIDLEDVFDPAPREGPDDLSHWSSPSLNENSISLGPYSGIAGEEHRLYIEASDNLGLKSLAIVKIQVIRASFRPGSILIVKDTRYKPDGILGSAACVDKPKGPWPTQAELDSFLFARGGFPWRCYVPATQSRRGLFYGYSFDTLGTRIRKNDLTVRLSTLARYEHVIWITDRAGAISRTDGVDASNPQTALRYINDRGRFNSLSAYVKLGGKVWMVGGGAGYAATVNFDASGNNQPYVTFSNALGELAPGRFMYDAVGWRSAFRNTVEPAAVRRYGGRYEGVVDPGVPYTRYVSELPRQLELRTTATDTLPPYRTGGDNYFVSTVPLEYLFEPNLVAEDIDPDPDVVTTATTLDTLMEGAGIPSTFPNPHNVVMTYAHGPAVPQGLVFTGFDLWSFRKIHSRAVVDFVLRRIWNLAPASLAAGASGSESMATTAPSVARATLPRRSMASAHERVGRGDPAFLERLRVIRARDANSARPR